MDAKTIKKIIKSRIISKNNLGEWYQDRVEKCLSCDFWSGNNSNKRNIFYLAANFGKDYCTKCGCGVNKLKLKEEKCPIGQWQPIEDVMISPSDISIENLSEHKVKMSRNTIGEYILDYGDIEQGYDSWIDVKINPLLQGLSINSSCGCTVPSIETKENYHKLSITYNTKTIGKFTKTVVVNYKEDDIKKNKIVFKITGNVQ